MPDNEVTTKRMTMVYKVTLEIPETMSRIAVTQQLHLKFTGEAELVGVVVASSSHATGDFDADL